VKIEVLDHGYVESIESWGTGRGSHVTLTENTEMVAYQGPDYEVGIVEAARQSTQGSFRGWDQDQKLLTHLYNHNHATPFEFAGLVIEVQAPIFVFREWQRHRTQSYNEMSARYAPLPDLYYEPDYHNTMERAKAATNNKQAGGVNMLKEDEDVGFWLEALVQTYDQCEKVYKVALEKGIPKELARLVMPVGHYSRMRASANLRNWLAFMTLRCDPKAQWEIRQYADAVSEIIRNTFPRTHKLWAEI
jgi:thymidylate synthase (FAD)